MCAYLSNKKEGNSKRVYLFIRGDINPPRPDFVFLINEEKKNEVKKNRSSVGPGRLPFERSTR